MTTKPESKEDIAKRMDQASHVAAEAIDAGAHIITAPPDVYQMALACPLVDEDVVAFNKPFDEGGLLVPGRVAK